jgi:hypothetical protein
LPTTGDEVTPGVRPNGSSIIRLTYYHQQPANAITILKAVWQGDTLMKLGFMKGFTHEQTNDASGDHRTRGGPPTARKASREGH